jgi:hypothetical protein
VKLTPPSAKLLGEPLAYRSGSRMAVRPVAGFEFARNERIRVEWPVLAALDRREVRLLDRSGKALPVECPCPRIRRTASSSICHYQACRAATT